MNSQNIHAGISLTRRGEVLLSTTVRYTVSCQSRITIPPEKPLRAPSEKQADQRILFKASHEYARNQIAEFFVMDTRTVTDKNVTKQNFLKNFLKRLFEHAA